MSAPEYPIGTLRQMAAIPEDALPRFLAELPTIIAEARKAYAAADKVNAILDGAATITTLDPSWVDDDLDQFTTTVKSGGEVIGTSTIKRGAR